MDTKQLKAIIKEGIMDGIKNATDKFFEKGYPEGKPMSINDVIKGNGWIPFKTVLKSPEVLVVAVGTHLSLHRVSPLGINDLIDDLNIYLKDTGSKYRASTVNKEDYSYTGNGLLIKFSKPGIQTESVAHRDITTIPVDTLDVFPELNDTEDGDDIEAEINVDVIFEYTPEEPRTYDYPGYPAKAEPLFVELNPNVLNELCSALNKSEDEIKEIIETYIIENDLIPVDKINQNHLPDPDDMRKDRQLTDF